MKILKAEKRDPRIDEAYHKWIAYSIERFNIPHIAESLKEGNSIEDFLLDCGDEVYKQYRYYTSRFIVFEVVKQFRVAEDEYIYLKFEEPKVFDTDSTFPIAFVFDWEYVRPVEVEVRDVATTIWRRI